MIPVSIIIPSYNGLELLKRLLPSILNLINNVEDYELLVVDDGSEDGTESYLRNHFTQIRVIVLRENVGFAKACNLGVANAKHDLILILNNDVLIDSDFLPKVLGSLSEQDDGDKKLFAVTCKVLKEDRKTPYHVRNEGVFHNGEIMIKPLTNGKGDTFFASGVIMVFHKEMFFELGGFDDLYYPFYWEDVDICYRALKKGYKILYEPDSVVYHKDQRTIVFSKKGRFELFFSKMYARIIQERNQYLFTWKNLLDRDLILRHISLIPFHLVISFGDKNHIFRPIGFLFALMRLRNALKKRREEKEKTYILKDRQILNIVSSAGP